MGRDMPEGSHLRGDSMTGAGKELRELPVTCVRCRWTAHLKPSVVNPENYDITALNGWEIGDDAGALCERCADGWKPLIVQADDLKLVLDIVIENGMVEPAENPAVDRLWAAIQ